MGTQGTGGGWRAAARPWGCGDCLERLYPYLDRELSPAELDQVKGHLEGCGDCEHAFYVERVFIDQIRGSATSEVAPADVRERLILRIRDDLRPTS